MSAVSNRVMPRSIALWITLREVSRSVRWPKLLQPRPTAETRRPERPRLRISMNEPCQRSEVADYCPRCHRLQAPARHAAWAPRSGDGRFGDGLGCGLDGLFRRASTQR